MACAISTRATLSAVTMPLASASASASFTYSLIFAGMPGGRPFGLPDVPGFHLGGFKLRF